MTSKNVPQLNSAVCCQMKDRSIFLSNPGTEILTHDRKEQIQDRSGKFLLKPNCEANTDPPFREFRELSVLPKIKKGKKLTSLAIDDPNLFHNLLKATFPRLVANIEVLIMFWRVWDLEKPRYVRKNFLPLSPV